MRTPALCIVLLVAGMVAAQPLRGPTPAELRALIQQLGSEDYAQREAAGKKLAATGAPAVEELRAASRSGNPEVVRRARELLRKIEARIANEKALAPTLVELQAHEERLDDVLAELSKQAGAEVVLNGPGAKELANRKVTLSTRGKVPFWQVVVGLCEQADLQLAAVGGFSAPGSLPLRMGRSEPGIRTARGADRTVVLEARGDIHRRPAAVYGAVLVEAIPLPKGASHAGSATILQVWPEPRLAWQSTTGLKVSMATDSSGVKLVPDPNARPVTPPTMPTRRGTVIIRNVDGSARLGRDDSGFEVAGKFRPNARQALAEFKMDGRSGVIVKELGASVFGTVQSGVDPLAQAGGLEENKTTSITGSGGVELSVRYEKNNSGRLVAIVTLTYERHAVQHAGVGIELPGVRGGGPGLGNQTIHGVRITDADGKPFTLGYVGGTGRSGGNMREVMSMTLELHPDKDGSGPPAQATFWGTYARPVEIPVVLRDVPLGGK